MKYLKTFRLYESIIVPDMIESDMEIESYDDLVKYGEENGFDVVEYGEFYSSLSDDDKKSAPPERGGPPFFALFHPIRKKPMFVVSDRMFFDGMPMPPPHMMGRMGMPPMPPGRGMPMMPPRMGGRAPSGPPPRPPYKEIINDIMGHEMIHKSQSERRKIEYSLPSPTDTKKYLSNKDEVMAFSWSIANEISKGCDSIKDCLRKLRTNKIWIDVKKNCDIKTQNRYKKYIYLYLEDKFQK